MIRRSWLGIAAGLLAPTVLRSDAERRLYSEVHSSSYRTLLSGAGGRRAETLPDPLRRAFLWAARQAARSLARDAVRELRVEARAHAHRNARD